jgi:transcriptional regulator of arginine metabolism
LTCLAILCRLRDFLCISTATSPTAATPSCASCAARACAAQEDLVGLLKADGFDVTQSSVSRDMRELGVLKAKGRYLPPGDEVSQAQGDFAAIARFVREIKLAGPSLTVVKTSVGAAGSVAVAIDKAEWPEVVGTICVATQDAAAQQRLVERLRTHFRI